MPYSLLYIHCLSPAQATSKTRAALKEHLHIPVETEQHSLPETTRIWGCKFSSLHLSLCNTSCFQKSSYEHSPKELLQVSRAGNSQGHHLLIDTQTHSIVPN